MTKIFAVILLSISGFAFADFAETAGTRFGFSGPEIFPIDVGIGQLRAADINGDGLQDLVVVNNARSRIQILLNQTGKTNLQAAASAKTGQEINALPADSRFRIESVASEKRISSLVVADLNNDVYGGSERFDKSQPGFAPAADSAAPAPAPTDNTPPSPPR